MRGNSAFSTDSKKICLVKSSRKFDYNRSASVKNAVNFYDTDKILLNLRQEGAKSNYLCRPSIFTKDSSNPRILAGSSFSRRVHQEKMPNVAFKNDSLPLFQPNNVHKLSIVQTRLQRRRQPTFGKKMFTNFPQCRRVFCDGLSTLARM